MQPLNSKPLVSYGESFKRLGNTTRVVSYEKMKHVEDAILKYSHLPASADVSPIHPPFFTEFTYTDVLGGMYLRTFSAEINNRLVLKSLGIIEKKQYEIEFLKNINDKYKLTCPDVKYENVIFLPGHNIFDQVVDQQKLFELMDSDDSIVIKPHPISGDVLIRNLGQNFGYKRILDKDLAGHTLVLNCKNVYSVTTSELPIVAMLNGIPYHDITNYLSSYSGVLSPVTNYARKYSIDQRKQIILNLLLSEDSGFILPSMGTEEIKNRINKYCERALKEREVFKMTTPQRLTVQKPTVSNPVPKEASKNEIQQIRK